MKEHWKVAHGIFAFIHSSGKARRLTFVECNNDINTMIDLAKVADLVSVAKLQPCDKPMDLMKGFT